MCNILVKKEIQYSAEKLLGPVPIGAYEIFEGKLPRAIQRSHKLLNLAVQIHDTNRITVPVWVLEPLQGGKFDLPRIFPTETTKPRKTKFSETQIAKKGSETLEKHSRAKFAKGFFGILEKGKTEERKRVVLERVEVNEEPGVEIGDEIGVGIDEILIVDRCNFGLVKDCYNF